MPSAAPDVPFSSILSAKVQLTNVASAVEAIPAATQ